MQTAVCRSDDKVIIVHYVEDNLRVPFPATAGGEKLAHRSLEDKGFTRNYTHNVTCENWVELWVK